MHEMERLRQERLKKEQLERERLTPEQLEQERLEQEGLRPETEEEYSERILGHLGCIGLVVLVGIGVGIAYVAWHFITKYW
ncbi:MAG TPA: hypothetical protein VFD73_01355 [Gemmatimonadales bacterium]|nr:hypothetical protein [Gemmatimonadales bacterium]